MNCKTPTARLSIGRAIGFLSLLLVGAVGIPTSLNSAGREVSPSLWDTSNPPVDELVSRMMTYRKWHDDALRDYQAHRRFHASTTRFNMDSTMEVETTYKSSPSSMQSTVVRQEGSSFINGHVFERILQGEAELSTNTNSDVIPDNYEFAFIGRDDCQGRRCWRLALKARRKDKYLLDGEVWLDAEDFGVCRVHGITSKNLSIWVSRTEIDLRFQRINGIWLTERVESSSNVRLNGSVQMQIEYTYSNVGLTMTAKAGL